jgi:hypothetical protein
MLYKHAQELIPKAMTTNTSQSHIKATSQNPQESNTRKHVGEVGEPYSDSGHET